MKKNENLVYKFNILIDKILEFDKICLGGTEDE